MMHYGRFNYKRLSQRGAIQLVTGRMVSTKVKGVQRVMGGGGAARQLPQAG